MCQGLEEKVEYLQTLGIKNVVLSSVFSDDKGEVVDFMKVNASLGNESSLKDLVMKLKSKGNSYISLLNKICNNYIYIIIIHLTIFFFFFRYESNVEIST